MRFTPTVCRQNCALRSTYCHAFCPAYQREQEENAARLKAEHEEAEYWAALKESKERCRRKTLNIDKRGRKRT